MEQPDLIPHLFRTEFRKIVSVLCKRFGIEHIEVAEDVASETFLSAIETWTYNGIPENPVAWLYMVAKNKAKNHINRDNLFAAKIAVRLKEAASETPPFEIDLSEKNITDSQLQMLFALCHPSVPVDAQIGLSLRVLCGFGIDEIADAFLTNKETINKRLFRAKEKLRVEKLAIEFPGVAEISDRLETVLTTLYLLFNEGYYSESKDTVLREDLCIEAMRLVHLLIDNEQTSQPSVKALFALMCFHASRFAARRNEHGEMILYHDQDEARWDQRLISQGAYYLHQASGGERLSKYHIEASIAYWLTIKNDSVEKWNNVLQLYNQLLVLAYSPIAALNRTYVLSKVKGNALAICEAEKLQLLDNPYYFTLLGELYGDVDRIKARVNLVTALSLAKTQSDRHFIQQKIDNLG